MKKSSFIASWMALGALLSVDSAHAVLKTVVLQGDPSPNSGLAYRRMKLPAASDAAGERIAFYSPTDSAGRCIFRVDTAGGPGTLVVCTKTPTPDGRLFLKLQDPSINLSGTPAFASATSFGNDGVYRGIPPTVVALTNDPVGLVFIDNPSNVSITDGADVVFLAELTGGSAGDAALLRCSGGDGNCSPQTAPPGTGTLTTLVRVGDAVPDRAGREFCSFLGARASTFGVAFTASTKLDCTDNAETAATGIFRLPFLGAVTTVALVGEASGVGPTTWSNFRGTPSIANNGKIGFQSDLAGTPSAGLFLCDPATCPAASPTVAVEIGQLDGSNNAFRYFSPPSVSDAGDLAFNTRLSGGPAGVTNGLYVWRSATDTFDVIGLKNDPVPGVIGGIFTSFLQGPPSMTSTGRVAFKAKIKRPVAPRNRVGIFIDE